MSTKIVKAYHMDHGVSERLVSSALSKVKSGAGFFLFTVELPTFCLESGLYGPASGDDPVGEGEVTYAQRTPDRPPSRLVARGKRPTNKLTIIGLMGAGRKATVFTAYGGPCAPREPWDASHPNEESREQSRLWWAQHALAK